MNIAFVYPPGRVQRLESVREKTTASEFFYGGEELRRRGHQVTMYEVDRSRSVGWRGRVVDYLFAKGVLPNRTRGWVFWGVHRHLQALNTHDVIVATSTGLAFSLGIWKMLGRVRPGLVAIHCGIFNYHPNWLRRHQMSSLLRRMWSVVFGEGEFPAMQRVFQIEPGRLRVNAFGVDGEFWTPRERPEAGGYILAVGNDARRDYELLVRAVAELPFRCVILTRQTIRSALPPHVEVRTSSWHSEGITDGELRDLYRGAACVVVPLIESCQPSGQSVTLQAMACGRPVILTRTSGLWSPADMRGGENVEFVLPGDVDGLRRTIETLMNDPARRARLGQNARRTVEERFTIGAFAERMEQVCRDALVDARRSGQDQRREDHEKELA